jgi:hypothetical protein
MVACRTKNKDLRQSAKVKLRTYPKTRLDHHNPGQIDGGFWVFGWFLKEIRGGPAGIGRVEA